MKNALEEGEADEYEMQAKLHNKQVKRPPKVLKIKEEDRKKFDSQAEQLQKRLRRQYLENQFKRGQDGK